MAVNICMQIYLQITFVRINKMFCESFHEYYLDDFIFFQSRGPVLFVRSSRQRIKILTKANHSFKNIFGTE